jgi:hypothetical protein
MFRSHEQWSQGTGNSALLDQSLEKKREEKGTKEKKRGRSYLGRRKGDAANAVRHDD